MSDKAIVDLVGMIILGIVSTITLIGFFGEEIANIIRASRGDDDE